MAKMPKSEELEVDGRTKAAVLLASLEPEVAGRVLSKMQDEEIESLTMNLSSLGSVDPDVRQEVVSEFHQMYLANRYVTQGGVEYARSLLESGLGPERALEILTRLQSTLQEVPFEFLKRADPGQIVTFVRDEHPQTISLILAHLDPGVSSIVLSALPPEARADIVLRIATMDRTTPEVVREVERVLERKMEAVFSQGFTFAGGVKEVAEILNRIERTNEKTIMADLEARDPDLADEISRLMFTFDDLVSVDDGGIQKALRSIEQKDLALALKTANDEVSEKILKNMSERAAQLIREDMEYMGPVRVSDVEASQQKIVDVVRRLEDAGEIIISGRGGEKELIV